MSFGPDRLESAIAKIEAVGDPTARAVAKEAVTAILGFHREALQHLSSRVREASTEGESIWVAAAEDDVVASLFSLHGLHPVPIESRVRQALVRIQAVASAEAGRMDVISVDGAAIRVRVGGSERIRLAVKRAIEDAAPEVERVEVAGVDPDLVPVERLVRSRSGVHERCDLCGAELAPEHAHLFDVERRRLTCTCAGCCVLLDSNSKKRRVVRRQAVRLEHFQISDAEWEALKVPVRLAFFSRSSALGAVVAAYPGPAGAIESTVPSVAWDVIVQNNAALASLEADTQALLVHRQDAAPRYYVVSIDECYRLTGIVRSLWRGLTGGDGPARAIEEFFAALTQEDRS